MTFKRPQNPRINAVYFDGSGGITLEWQDASEQDDYGAAAHTVHITPYARSEWEEVSYYSKELEQDVIELLDYFLRHRAGVM